MNKAVIEHVPAGIYRKIPRKGIAGLYGEWILTVQKATELFFKWLNPSVFTPAMDGISNCTTFLYTLAIVNLIVILIYFPKH